VFSGVFIAGEVDGVGDKGSGDTRMVFVTTLLEACELDPEICLFD
jgi:hypothetical protein